MTPPDPSRLRIVMLVTRGVPAHYGGFETAVEEVGRRLAARGHKVLVYSRNPDPSAPLPPRHLGMRVVELPALKRRSLETLSHTALSVAFWAAVFDDGAISLTAGALYLLHDGS